jgi:lysophospholipase L1-like esterase
MRIEPATPFALVLLFVPFAVPCAVGQVTNTQRGAPLRGASRVAFLGDSITYAGQYVEYLEAYVRLSDPTIISEFLDLGLPSETLSGLSEPGHAGGQFPRPDLHERLDRVLERTKPSLIVACYGMNDGIYHPFAQERFEKYQAGMQFLRDRAEANGAKVLHVTPPVFDPAPIKSRTLPAGLAEYRQPYAGYDEVLERYSEWLLAQRSKGWDVVDAHGPMKRFLNARRAKDAAYWLADDGVHINGVGHWLITRAILTHWGFPEREGDDPASGEKNIAAFPHGLATLALVSEKQRLLKDAWLTAISHKRPGMNRGKPLDVAQRDAEGIEKKIRAILASREPVKPK